MNRPPKIQILAAEPSGDRLGAGLVRALRAERGEVLSLSGLGGPAMEEAGVESLFPVSELAVMGLAEVIPKIPRLRRRIRETVRMLERERPDVVVTVDSPDFMHRIVNRVQHLRPQTRFVNFVAPTVWMWRPGRARRIARLYDLQLALLPFEPPYFEREGLACRFVGHPAAESGGGTVSDRDEARAKFGLHNDTRVIVVLPGSRVAEVSRHGTTLGQAVERLSTHLPDLVALVPAAHGVEHIVRELAATWRFPAKVLSAASDAQREEEKRLACAAADIALAVSGTVAVELAAARVPMVIAYRMAPLTWAIVRRLARRDFACLINILLDRQVVPEFLQERCCPDLLSEELWALLQYEERRKLQSEGVEEALRMLVGEGDPPSKRAARAVLEFLGEVGS